ncbi:hypothetical protein N864_07605 [Intrasporangium chromatireducens Q5-1]|uniref:Uncharacterized protein n=1 Tax=Intrasporangium chromatireducens Q5-1 TaxID=584657 RepID=W9GFS1_9MICO|nr:hypothetical protein [Intrasporangium chromatireducens]EWT05056.1 hypothetical protein N864_07605 [Intrasporangium chromatireducens Q5-1]
MSADNAEAVVEALRSLYGERVQLRHGLEAVIVRDPAARARRLAKATARTKKPKPQPAKPPTTREELNPEAQRAYDAWLASQDTGKGA